VRNTNYGQVAPAYRRGEGIRRERVGPLFAKIYRGNLEKAIPLLVAEWEF
jgi:hypothetical protein